MKIFIHTNHFFLPKNSPHFEFQSMYFLIRKLTYLESIFCILMLVLSAGSCRVSEKKRYQYENRKKSFEMDKSRNFA